MLKACNHLNLNEEHTTTIFEGRDTLEKIYKLLKKFSPEDLKTILKEVEKRFGAIITFNIDKDS